jgi:septal ring factor EnvC (AmiA/AmiB activator)
MDTDVKDLLDSLHSHQLKINGLLAVVIALVLGVFGFIYMHSVRSYESALGKAEERESEYMKSMAQIQQDWKAAQQKIADLAEEKSKVQTQIVYRDKQTDTKIQEIQKPDRSADQVWSDLKTFYPNLLFTQYPLQYNDYPDLFAVSKPQIQGFVATKLDRDRLDSALQSTNTLLALEKQSTQQLTTQVESCQAELKKSPTVIDGYKNVAKKTKFQRVADAAKFTAAIVLAAFIGKHL